MLFHFRHEFDDGAIVEAGYGGFNYLSRFWQPVVPTLQQHFGLSSASSLLDVGCAKGFMLHDLAQLIPGITVKAVDVSAYAIENAIEDMKTHVQVADARKMEGSGARVRFELRGVVASFHRPHPRKEATPYPVRDARRFLEEAGIKP